MSGAPSVWRETAERTSGATSRQRLLERKSPRSGMQQVRRGLVGGGDCDAGRPRGRDQGTSRQLAVPIVKHPSESGRVRVNSVG